MYYRKIRGGAGKNFKIFKAKLERAHFFKVQSGRITVCIQTTWPTYILIKVGSVDTFKMSNVIE